MLNTRMIKLGLWEVVVPRNVRYILDWSDYTFAEFPRKCIIDKQIPGCGYTEWCIQNMFNVILASPRKTLLENKYDQHLGEVFLVKNELDRDPGVDKDLTKTKNPGSGIEKELSIEQLGFSTPDTYDKIRNELLEYLAKKGVGPYKILVTYDSYYIIKNILEDLGIFNTFYTVVDEFQSILHDSRFKSTTEVEFMEVLKDVEYVQFISATPMLDRYISMLPDFANLERFRFNWEKEDPSRVIKPNLKVLVMKSIGEVLPGIIKDYKSGNFDKISTVDSKTREVKEIVSDEAVFYLNSVNHIINIIKKYGLLPEECNILCSNTPENAKRIRTKLGASWNIGKVPLKGVKPKMFTFCTRTVYLGADFYSTCAKSYIFSDANSDCLAVDISQDLPQILGRQRLSENPWKNSATFYYRSTADWRKKSREDFDAFIKTKLDKTDNLLRAYQNNVDLGASEAAFSLAEEYRRSAKTFAYKYNYVAVNSKSNQLVPVINDYVRVADIRAFDIQQIDYADRFTVFRELEDKIYGDKQGLISSMISAYDQLKNNISDRLKFICEVDPNLLDIFLQQLNNDDYAKSYYLQLGPDRCRALGYKIDRIRKELGIIKFDKQFLEKEIHLIFSSGQKISKAALKLMLADIYKRVNYDRVAKASDLSEWFELKLIKVKESDGTYSNGFELLKKK